jgi:hypothetical protein
MVPFLLCVCRFFQLASLDVNVPTYPSQSVICNHDNKTLSRCQPQLPHQTQHKLLALRPQNKCPALSCTSKPSFSASSKPSAAGVITISHHPSRHLPPSKSIFHLQSDPCQEKSHFSATRLNYILVPLINREHLQLARNFRL